MNRYTVAFSFAVTALAALAACRLPCNTTSDCPTGQTCDGATKQCNPADVEPDSTASSSSGQAASSSSSGGSSSSTSSGGSSSSSGGSSSSSSGSSSSSSGAAPCPLPNLLALVQSDSGASSTRGQVLRFALGTDGTFLACAPLSVRQTLSSRASMVGWAGNGHVVVGWDGHVNALDVTTDTIAWNYSQTFAESGYPLNTFLVDVGGQSRLAVVYALQSGDNDIKYVETLDPANGTRLQRFKTTESADPMYLGNLAYSGAAHPLLAGNLVYIRMSTWAAGNVVIPTGTSPVSPTSYIASLPDAGTPKYITSTKGPGNLGRIAFTQDGFGGAAARLWLANDPGTGPTVRGPFTCPAHCPAPLIAYHAVPDPMHADRIFGICETDNSTTRANIVRINIDGTCDLVLDGATLLAQSYPWRLTIAQ